MRNLIQYITEGAEISDTVTLYVNKAALRDFQRAEDNINKTLDPELVEDYEAQKAKHRQELLDSAVVIEMKLPSEITRKNVADITRSEFGVDSQDNETQEFLQEVTDRLLAKAIVSIKSPSGVEKAPFEVDDIRALRAALMAIPENWYKVVGSFNTMISQEVFSKIESLSPDFS